MKILLFLLSFYFLSPLCTCGQDQSIGQSTPKISFSDPFYFKDVNKLFANEILNVGDNYIYVLLESEPKYSSDKAWIQLIDKSTLQEMKKIQIDFTNSYNAELKLQNIIKTDQGFLLDFKSQDGKTKSVYGQILDFNFKPTTKIVKLADYDRKDTFIRLLANKTKIGLLLYDIVDKGENIVFHAKTYDSSFQLINEGSISTSTIPIYGKFLNRLAHLDILDDFILTETGEFINAQAVSNEDSEFAFDFMIYYFSPEQNNSIETKIVLDNNRRIGDYRIKLIDNNKLTITGIYYEERIEDLDSAKIFNLNPNPELAARYKPEGTFCAVVDVKQAKLISLNQNKFSEEQIGQLDHSYASEKLNGRYNRNRTYRIMKSSYNPESNTMICMGEVCNNWIKIATNEESGRTEKTYNSLRINLFIYEISLSNGNISWLSTIPTDIHLKGATKNADEITFNFYKKGAEEISVMYYSSITFDDHDPTKFEKFNEKEYCTSFLSATINTKSGTVRHYTTPKSQDKTDEMSRIGYNRIFSNEGKVYTINARDNKNSTNRDYSIGVLEME